ncbi:ABC transporter permease [Pseudothermotoga sp.]
MKLVRLALKNRLAKFSLTIVSIFALLALIAPWIVPYKEQALGEPNMAERLLSPSLRHPFGTDHMGRDILSRMIYGARTSLFTAVSVVFLSALIGVPIGIAAGYFGGLVDNVLMRFTDVFCRSLRSCSHF